MKIAITVGVYNEEKNIAELLNSLLTQTRLPEEIIIVDDGSLDKTEAIVQKYAKQYPIIKYIYQKNAGPAAARNRAWKNSNADICIFTDGDCIPEKDWVEKLVESFLDMSVGATAGTYKTLNSHNILARFIGLEIAYKYRNVNGGIDVHGTYNLAVRKEVLEEVGGLDESYPKASGEDWDLTYRISRKYKIIFVPNAIVGHYHPEKLFWYMRNQVRRGYDRVKVYKDHPEKRKGDIYTPWYIKYQVIISGMLIPSLALLFPVFKYSFFVPLTSILILLSISSIPFDYFFKKDKIVALYSIPLQALRGFAWFWGLVKGIIKFGI